MAISLDISAGQVQQTLSVFLIGLGIGQGMYGPLLDRFGRRAPLLGGLTLFVLGSLFAALTQSFEGLLVARLLQAIGAGAGAVTSRAVVSDRCDTQSSARIYSILMQVMMIAPITAPLIGGLILEYGQWQLIFWVLAAIGAACWLATLSLLPETLAVENRVPLSLSGIVRGYARQLTEKSFVFYTLATGFTLASLFIYISNSPFVFITSFGLTPVEFSYLFAANAIAMIVLSQLNLRLLKRYRAAIILYLGLAGFVLAGALLCLLVWFEQVSLWHYAVLLGFGIGTLGLITGNLTAVAMGYTRQHAGIASALLGLMQFMLAAALGFVVSFLAPSLLTLPAAFVVFGGLALLCCRLGQRSGEKTARRFSQTAA